MLTMLADDNVKYAAEIVQVVEAHLQKVPAARKLSALYLVDSIIKNVSNSCYPQLFSNNLASMFVAVFQKVDEKTRANMYKLRQTWTTIFPNRKLYALDFGVNRIDPAWPVTATPPDAAAGAHNIHVNPKFIMKQQQKEEARKKNEEEQHAAKVVDALRRQKEAIFARQQSEMLKRKQEEENTRQRKQQEEVEHRRQEEEMLRQQQAADEERRKAADQQRLELEQREAEAALREQLLFKHQELLKLQQQRMELELEQQRIQVEEQKRALQQQQEELLRKREEERLKAEEKAKAPKDEPVSTSNSASISTGTHATSSTSVTEDTTKANKEPAARDPRLVKLAQKDPRSRGSSPVASPSTLVSELEKIKSVSSEKDKIGKKVPVKPASKSPSKKTGLKKALPKKPEGKDAIKRTSREKELPKSYRDRSPDKRGRGGRSRNTRPDFRPRNQRSRSPESTKGPSRPSTASSKTTSKRRGSKTISPTRSRSRTRSKSPNSERSPRGDWRKRNYRSRSSNGEEEEERWEGDGGAKQARGHHDQDRVHSKPRARRRSSEEETRETPPVKKTRQDEEVKEEKKDTLSSDLIGLFGSEDQDYRRLPPIPKLPRGSEPQPHPSDGQGQLPLQSPRQEGWARFKASRPEEFPFAQPRRASIDVLSPDFQMPGPALLSPTDRDMSPDQKDLVPKPHMLNRAEDVLQQADLQFKNGRITYEQYQELLAQMNELYAIQKLRMEERLKAQGKASSSVDSSDRDPPSHRPILELPDGLGSPPKDRYSPGATGEPGQSRSFPRDEGPLREELLSDRPPGSPKRDAYLPPRAGSPAPHGHSMRPVPRPPLPPSILTERPEHRPSPPPRPPMAPPAGPMDRLYRDGPNPDMGMNSLPPDLPSEEFYVPQFDVRWAGKKHRGKDSGRRTHIVIIDGRSFDMKPNCVQRIRLGTRTFEIGIDQKTREVTIGGECYLKLGQPERTVVLSGRKYTIFARGQSKNIWIDNIQYDLFMDAPSEKIRLGNKEHLVELNSTTNMMLVDGFEVCPILNSNQQVHIAFQPHDIMFSPPPRNILIDNKMCQLNFSGEYPVVFMEGKPHGIRFDGHPREIWVNDVAYTVDMNKPRRCKLPSKVMRPFLLAFGGPGHEVIIEDQWYEVKFNGPDQVITLRDKKIRVRLEGPPPEVKILGEVVSPEQMQIIIEESAKKKWAGPAGGHDPRNVQPKVPSLLDLDIKPSMMQPSMGPNPGPMGRDGPLGPDGPHGPMRHDGMPDGPMRHGGPMGPPEWMERGGPMGPRGPGRGPMGFGPGPYMQGGPPNPGFGPQMGDPRMGLDMAPAVMQHGAMDPVMGGMHMGDNQGQQGDSTPAPSKPVDVNDLLSKLISAGIINKSEEKKQEKQETEKEKTEKAESKPVLDKGSKKKKPENEDDDSDEETIRDIEDIPDLTAINPEQLKKVYNGVIQQLFSGVQCPSCGIRFTTEDSDRYKEHLDWHFRQNQRDKDQIKVAKFRRWYYDESDWIQFEEIGDLEERAYSQFFETMMSAKQPGPGVGHTAGQGSDVISCPVAKGENDDVCDICGEAFEQFYDDDEEEWHLKDAVRANGKTYHPVCYDDFKETGSVADPETPTPTPTPDTPMPDPIMNPLAYLEHLSRKSKQQNQAANSEVKPAAAELAAAMASQVVTSTRSMPMPPTLTVASPVIKEEVVPAQGATETQVEEPRSSTPPPAVVKTEPETSPGEQVSTSDKVQDSNEPTAEVSQPTDAEPHQSKPAQTGSDQASAPLVQIKQEPMDTESGPDSAPTELVATGSPEPVGTSSVQIKVEEPVQTGSVLNEVTEPVQAGSVQIKVEPMQTDESVSEQQGGTGVEEAITLLAPDEIKIETDSETANESAPNVTTTTESSQDDTDSKISAEPEATDS